MHWVDGHWLQFQIETITCRYYEVIEGLQVVVLVMVVVQGVVKIVWCLIALLLQACKNKHDTWMIEWKTTTYSRLKTFSFNDWLADNEINWLGRCIFLCKQRHVIQIIASPLSMQLLCTSEYTNIGNFHPYSRACQTRLPLSAFKTGYWVVRLFKNSMLLLQSQVYTFVDAKKEKDVLWNYRNRMKSFYLWVRF